MLPFLRATRLTNPRGKSSLAAVDGDDVREVDVQGRRVKEPLGLRMATPVAVVRSVLWTLGDATLRVRTARKRESLEHKWNSAAVG
jgi:hypothetical protein